MTSQAGIDVCRSGEFSIKLQILISPNNKLTTGLIQFIKSLEIQIKHKNTLHDSTEVKADLAPASECHQSQYNRCIRLRLFIMAHVHSSHPRKVSVNIVPSLILLSTVIRPPRFVM